MTSHLRDYQSAAVESAITWHKYKSEPAIISLPTGSGKSHVIAALAEHYYNLGERVAILAHRKELLVQNGGKLLIPHGYCSASLGDKDLHERVIVGGIQTIVNRQFEPFNRILIDECHRVSNNDELGQYWRFIGRHPEARVIGLTATPYRTTGGNLSWGEVVYTAHYNNLLAAGYLAPLTNKLKHQPNLSEIKITAGDYNEEQLANFMQDPALIEASLKHIIAYGADRKSCLIFCVTVKHCALIHDAMAANGLSCGIIHGAMDDAERDAVIADFKCGRIKYLINCQILLEGFDHPPVDMIVCLRPTMSKGLWEQMLGRGVRLHPGKENCLLIDMAGNLAEHGGMGTPYREPAKREAKREHGKICPNCEEFVQPVNAKECPCCGYEFIAAEARKAGHEHEADTERSVTYNATERHEVKDVSYREHVNKAKKTRSIRVSYYTNYGIFSEWLAAWSDSDWARNKTRKFYKDRGVEIEGDTKDYSVQDLLFLAEGMRKPAAITIDVSEKYPRVTAYEWEKTEEASRGSDTAGVDSLGDDFIPF